MSNDAARTLQLQRELVTALCHEKGMSEVEALPFVETIVRCLQSNHGGSRLYIPANQPYRAYDVEAITADLKNGYTVAAIRKKHHISRATLYRLLSKIDEAVIQVGRSA